MIENIFAICLFYYTISSAVEPLITGRIEPIRMKKDLIFIIAIIAFAVALAWWYVKPKTTAPIPLATVAYLCQDGKTIAASYYQGTPIAVKPGEMPTPTGSVNLKLSDGRTLALPQTISASGIRYANQDESFVFWSKGNGAFMVEHDTNTYNGCVALANNPGDLPNSYVNQQGTFSIRYPDGYKVDPSYVYQELGPGKDINGVKFIIPEAMATGTNLSGFDTGLSVEEIPRIQNCTASLFLYGGIKTMTETDNNVIYSVASTTGAAAGNRYEEDVWAIPDTNPCVALRYFIHSGNIYNYSPGTKREFDRTVLLSEFDAIRHSLVVAP